MIWRNDIWLDTVKVIFNQLSQRGSESLNNNYNYYYFYYWHFSQTSKKSEVKCIQPKKMCCWFFWTISFIFQCLNRLYIFKQVRNYRYRIYEFKMLLLLTNNLITGNITLLVYLTDSRLLLSCSNQAAGACHDSIETHFFYQEK